MIREGTAAIRVECVSDPERLPDLKNEFVALAQVCRSRLPFHQGDLPLLWWKHFHSEGNVSYGQIRKRNTFGVSSRVTEPAWFAARCGGQLVAAAPMVRIKARLDINGGSKTILSFCGDSALIPYTGLLLHPEMAEEAAAALITAVGEQLENGVDVICLGYIPSASQSHRTLEAALGAKVGSKVTWVQRKICRAGGIHPWTLEGLRTNLAALATIDPSGVGATRELFAETTPAALFFPATRKRLEEGIIKSVEPNRGRPEAVKIIDTIDGLLKSQPIHYPYIELPDSVEEYQMSLSRETRRYFRRYRRRFVEAGGIFEKVAGPGITECDIEDFLRLHVLRFGRESAVINDATAMFHRELCRSAGAAGYFTLFFALFDGKRVATQSCFDIQGRREGYLSGRDKTFEEWGVGRLLCMETIEDAISGGFDIYDLGYGGVGYKTSFTASNNLTSAYIAATNGAMPDLSQLVTGYEKLGDQLLHSEKNPAVEIHQVTGS